MWAETPNLDFIRLDNRLRREEIRNMRDIALDDEKLKALENEVKSVESDTKKDFENFINTEYKWANEWYLRKKWKSVKELQKALSIEDDWYFWKNTFFALIKFQKENGLTPDGLAWPMTQKKLFSKQYVESVKTVKSRKTHDILATYFRWKGIQQDSRSEKISLRTNLVDSSNWFDSIFTSLPAEKKWNMTYCSRTARKNLYRLWIPRQKVPQWPSAIDSMKMYNSPRYDDISELPESANVLDLFVDSSSPYEHRAVAYLKKWQGWMVLDPYSKWSGISPMPLDKYLSSKKVLWIFPHTSTKVA